MNYSCVLMDYYLKSYTKKNVSEKSETFYMTNRFFISSPHLNHDIHL